MWKKEVAIGKVLRQSYERKVVQTIEANACMEYMHMLVSTSLNMSVSRFVECLKGKRRLIIFEKFLDLKYLYGNIYFFHRGYYIDIVRRNKKSNRIIYKRITR